MLGGIALLTAAIGKTTSSVIDAWRKGMKGKGDFTGKVGHTVLIGWEGASSERVIELLLQDETSNDNLIVICDCSLEENPMPGKAAFIRGESLSSTALLLRAGVPGAERVLVRTPSDDLTLATVLAVNQLSPVGHVVAHFNESEIAALASSYAPRLEVGDYVTRKTVLGYVGSTGNADGTPPHLHFGVYATTGAIDPLPLLTDRPKEKKITPKSGGTSPTVRKGSPSR